MADSFSDLSDTLDNLISDEEEGEIIEPSETLSLTETMSSRSWGDYDKTSSYYARRVDGHGERIAERKRSDSGTKDYVIEDRENKVVWKPGLSIEISVHRDNGMGDREDNRRKPEQKYRRRSGQETDSDTRYKRETRRRRIHEEQKIPRSRKRISSEDPDSFEAMAKRCRSRFRGGKVLALPSAVDAVSVVGKSNSVQSENEIESSQASVQTLTLVSGDNNSIQDREDVDDVVIDLDNIPLPMDISDDETVKEISDDIEEEDIRMRLALLRSMADQNDPEISLRFAEIQKLLDEKADLDDGFVSLDDIPLPASMNIQEDFQKVNEQPTQPACVVVVETKVNEHSTQPACVVVAPTTEEKGVETQINPELAKQRKQKAKLFKIAKAKVDEAFSQGWNEFGSLFQDTLHNLKNKKIESDDGKVLCRYASSLVDTLLEKKEFVPPWVVKVRENCKTILEGSQTLAEEEDEVTLREALLKSLAAKKEQQKVEKPVEPAPTPPPAEEVPEEDIELMRAMLLVQVSRKARSEADALTSNKTMKKSASTRTLDTMNITVPRVNPIIIKITPHSDDECEWSGESHAEMLRRTKEAKNRKFAEILKSAKKIQKQSTENILLSEDAIKLLPQQMQHEYHSLKQRLNLLDKKKKVVNPPPPLKVQNQSKTNETNNNSSVEGVISRPASSGEVSKENLPVVEEDVAQLEKRLTEERQDLSVTLDKTISRLKELAAEKEREQKLELSVKQIQEKIEALQKELICTRAELEECKVKKGSLAETVKLLREEFAVNQKKCSETEKLCLQVGTRMQGKRFQLQPFHKKVVHDKVVELRMLCANLKTDRNKLTQRCDVVSNSINVTTDAIPKKVQKNLSLPPSAQGSITSSNFVESTSKSTDAACPSSSSCGFQIDPMRIVCPHDLHGLCKDTNCVFQHLPRPSLF